MYDFTLQDLESSEEYTTADPELQKEYSREFISTNGADDALSQLETLLSSPEVADFSPEEQDTLKNNYLDYYGIEEPQEERTAAGAVKDIGVSAAKGFVSIGDAIQGLIDIPANGKFGLLTKKFGFDPKAANEILDTYYSESQQHANKKVDDASGFIGTIEAMVKNPSTIAHMGIESIPLMFAGGAVGKGLRYVAPKVAPYIAGAIGEGTVGAGLASSEMRRETGGELSGKQTGMALASGAGTALFGAVGGRVAKKFGFLDPDTMIVSRGGQTKAKNVGSRIVAGGISEGAFEELPQTVQEQIWQNAALDKPLLEGVPEGAAQGLLIGGAMGGAVNLVSSPKPPPSVDDIAAAIDEIPEDASPEEIASLVSDIAKPKQESYDFTEEDLLAIEDFRGIVSRATDDEAIAIREKLDLNTSNRIPEVSEALYSIIDRRLDGLSPAQDIPSFPSGDVPPISTTSPASEAPVISPPEPLLGADSYFPNTDQLGINGPREILRQAQARQHISKIREQENETSGEVLQDTGPVLAPGDQDIQQEIPNLPEETEETGQGIEGEVVEQPEISEPEESVPSKNIQKIAESVAKGIVYQGQEKSDAGLHQFVTDKGRNFSVKNPVPEEIKTAYEKINAVWDAKDSPKTEVIDNPDSIAHGEEVNTNPTEDQKKAENYKVVHKSLDGIKVSIENPAGTTRKGTSPDGKEWSQEMQNDYGRILGSVGFDKDHVDVFFSPGYDGGAEDVFVVNQYNDDGSFDEHKVVIGASTEDEALDLYNSNYEKGWSAGKSVAKMSMPVFKKWVKSKAPTRGPVIRKTGIPKPKKTTPKNTPVAKQAETKQYKSGVAWAKKKIADPKYKKDAAGLLAHALNHDKADTDFWQGVKAEAELQAQSAKAPAKEKDPASSDNDSTKDESSLGKNQNGQFVHEDENGNRGYVDTGFLLEAPVGVVPGGGVRVDSPRTLFDKGRTEYLTAEEVKKFEAEKEESKAPSPEKSTEEQIKELSDEDIDSLFDEVEAENKSEKAPPKPKADKPKPKARPKKTPKKIVKEGGIAANEAVKSAVKGLSELFGDPNTLGSGPVFDEETYQKAKPHFVSSWNSVKELGYSVKELIKYFYDKFGDISRPYLNQFLKDVRDDNLETEAPTDPGGKLTSDWPQNTIKISNFFYDLYKKGGWQHNSITGYRKLILDQFKAKDSGQFRKAVDEGIEYAVVKISRDIVRIGFDTDQGDRQIYEQLTALYNLQPNLKTRTSESVRNQAYSTPSPIAFVANALVGMRNTPGKIVYEPTAGTGMLLIGSHRGSTIANEIDPTRHAILEDQRFGILRNEDATGMDDFVSGVDVVIANPPFGKVKDSAGKNKVFNIDGLKTTEIDHAISLHSLNQMLDKGKGVLIIGGLNKQTPLEERSKKYGSGLKGRFFDHLYGKFKVRDHFTISGDLYGKQGAGWPIDIIVIDGKGESLKAKPNFAAPPIYNTFEEIGGRLEEIETGKETTFGVDATREQQDAAAPKRGPRSAAGGNSFFPSGAGAKPTGGQGNGSSSQGGGTGSGAGSQGTIRQDGPSPGRGEGADGKGPGDTDNGREPGTDELSKSPGEGADGSNRDTGSQKDSPGNDTESVDRGPGAGGRGKVIASQGQTLYNPVSDSGQIGTLVPANMSSPLQAALKDLSDKYGGVDNFVLETLQYKNKSELYKAFSAEQIDAIALALDNLKDGTGFILGDQTGIGKGRVVAAMIRYANLNGKVPVFVTEKQALYSDMYRDMVDIGFGPDVVDKIMQTNSDNVSLNDKDGVKLTSPTGWARTLGDTTGMPTVGKGKNKVSKEIVFTTYDQLNIQFERAGSDRPAPRRRFIQQLVNNADVVLIMDEAHNAGGSGDLENLRPDRRTGITPHPRALFFRQLIPQADGVIYSSATYAKSPDVMDLYSATDLRLGVGGDIGALADAVRLGGIPFQQVTAGMLTKAGQYIRRERSFDGVTYTPKVVEVDTRIAETVSSAMANIRQFEEAIIKPIFEADEEATAMGTVGDVGEQAQTFTSLMHNIIDQMLLALKVKPAVDEAIKMLRDGRDRNEQVVLTVSNTMGAFLDNHVEHHGTIIGGEIEAKFNDLLVRYLRNTRLYVTGDRDESDDLIKHYIEDSELGEAGVAAYSRLEDSLNALDLEGLPVSPVDYMLNELRQAGFPALEITGRDHTIDYSGDKPRLGRRDPKVRKVDGRNQTIKRFNDGEARAIILNRSGSTGISLHASERNPIKGQGKRTMFIVQAEKDINVHMQMLGRIHRTGQVITPGYIQAVANVPSERKPAALLVAKMASLNANTTADADSVLSDKTSINFLNKYGDRVVFATIRANPTVNSALGHPLNPTEEKPKIEGMAKKVMGRLPLLSLEQQDLVYDHIVESYTDYIAELDSIGRNDLEAKTFDLDAKTLETAEVIPSTGDSPFQAAAMAEKVDMKRIGKPFTTEQVKSIVEEHKGEGEVEAEEGLKEFDEFVESSLAEMQERIDEAETDSARAAAQERRRVATSKFSDLKIKFQTLNEMFKVGTPVNVDLNMDVRVDGGSELPGIVVGKIKRGKPINPLALSTWRVKIAVADGIRMVNLPFSRFNVEGSSDSAGEGVDVNVWYTTIEEAAETFDKALSISREERWILTGNIFAGFTTFREDNGRIINFTREDGDIEQGVLMPVRFDPQQRMSEIPVAFETTEQFQRFLDTVDSSIVKLRQTGDLRIVKHGDDRFTIVTHNAVSKAGRYFRDDRLLLDIVGSFTSRSNRMVTEDLTLDQAARVFELFKNRGNTWFTDTHLEEARGIVNGPSESPGSASGGRVITSEDGRAYILEDLVNSVFEAGQTLREFIKRLQEKLGKAFSEIRAEVKELYTKANEHLDRFTSGAQAGNVRVSDQGEPRQKPSSIFGAVAGPDKVDRLLAANPGIQDLLERAIYEYADKDDPRRRVLNRGESITQETDILSIERLRGKRTADEVDRFFKEMVQPLLKKLAESKLNIADLEEFAYSLHVPERNLRMQQVNAKGFIDNIRRELNTEETRELDNELIEIRSDNLMAGGTRSGLHDEYLGVLGRLFNSTADMQQELDDDQREHDQRNFTSIEISRGTPEFLQRRIDTRQEKIDSIQEIRQRWETESPRYAGITNQEAHSIHNKWSKDSRYKDLIEANKLLAGINAHKLDTLYNSGQLSKREYESMVEGYNFYVPLHRDVEEDTRPATGRPTGPTGHPLKVAKGSMKEVVDIVSHSVRNAQIAINRKHKAEAGEILLNFVRQNPGAGITVGKNKKIPKHDKEGNIVLYEDPKEADDELYLRVDGERYTLTFNTKDKTVARFLESIKESDMNLKGSMRLLGNVTRFIASMSTTFAPEFIITNFARDMQTAGLNMEDSVAKGMQKKVFKNVFPAIWGILKSDHGNEGHYWDKAYKDFSKHGGKIGWMQSYEEIKDLAGELESEMKMFEGGHVTKKSLRKIKDTVLTANLAVENGVRLATYDQLVNSGVSKQKAALTASNLTVDFTRRGRKGPIINSLYMFFNAGVQGNIRMVKAAVRSAKVRALIGGIMSTGFALQMLAYATGGDDESGEPYIDGLPDYIKERNMVFMIPGTKGKYAEIPMPYAYNVFFNIGAEAARAFNTTYFRDKKYNIGKGASRVFTSAMNSFNPLQSATLLQAISPTVVDPVVMIKENTTWSDSPLMPKQLGFGPEKADSFRYWKSASGLSKSVAQGLHKMTGGKGEYEPGMIDVSPETLELWVDTIGGSAAKFVKDVVTVSIDLATGEEVDKRRVPFVRKVTGEWNNRAISSRYYDQLDAIERFKNTYKSTKSRAEKIELKKDPRFKHVGLIEKADKTIRSLRKKKKQAELRGFDPKKYEDKITQIQARFLKRSEL